MSQGGRYLIVKLGALGDVVMASTLLGAIRAQDARAHVTWLCGARVAELVRLFEGVDEVVSVDDVGLLRGGVVGRAGALLAVWRRLLGARFDVTLLAHADRRYRALLMGVRGGRVRALGIQPGGRRVPVVGRYFGDEYVRLLDDDPARGPIAGHAPLAALRSDRPSREPPTLVGVAVVPGGGRNVLRESALRRWPVERYRALAEGLLAAGHRVTLVGDASDAWVRPAFAGLDVRDEIGGRSVPETVALLEGARLVVTHDTGPLHLAALAGTPILALFGPTIPEQFLLPHPRAEAIWGGAGLACRPCYDGREFAACRDNLCMQDIPVARVLRRALALLEGAVPPPAPEPSAAIFQP